MVVLGSFSASDFFPKVGWIIDRITGSHDEHLYPERLKPDHDDIIDVLLKLEKDQRSTIRLTNDHIKAILMHKPIHLPLVSVRRRRDNCPPSRILSRLNPPGNSASNMELGSSLLAAI
ncbi:hypothetical protein MKW92_027593 [Papaver armeniacum]|nr:hypothetical protein MKW92_027593 [Papaver armeniacum]